MKKANTDVSCHIVMDSRPNPAGLHKIIFRVYENRLKRDLFTGIRWPKQYYDPQSQLLAARYPSDPDVLPYNLRLNEYKARAHRMALSRYLKKTGITMDEVINEFRAIHNAEDFFGFMTARANELYNQDTIVNAILRFDSSLFVNT